MTGLIEQNLWWLFAILNGFISAVIYIVSQYLDIPANTKTFWRGLVPLIALTPVLFFIELPTTPIFYIATIATSFIAVYTDTKNFEASVKYGAGIVTRMKPFAIWLVFLIWFIIDSQTRQDFISAPFTSLAIVAALIFGVLSASYMNKCDVSRSAMKFYVPVVLGAATIDILNKTAMNASPLMGGIITYSWIQALIITIITYAIHHNDKDFKASNLFDRHILKYGLLIGFLFIVANIAKNSAMSFTPNPSYVTAIIFTNPVFVTLYYKIVKHKETANIYAGYGLVLSSILLILLANH